MSARTEFEIRKSPIVFLKRLVVIEFAFAFLPLVAILLFDAVGQYDRLALAQSVPFSILLTLILTALQILIVVLSFAAWYLPYYVINPQSLALKRAFGGTSKLADTQTITRIEFSQGLLGKRFDYGVLTFFDGDQQLGRMADVPDPDQVIESIMDMVDARPPAELPFAFDDPQALITAGEGQFVEFKASLLWDYRQQKPNKNLYEPVMKNLVGFMNSQGGVVLIGVGDDGEILGLEPDFKTLKKQNSDEFENVFNNAFRSMIGVEYHRFIDVSFPVIGEATVCMILVRPATIPAFLSIRDTEEFYIRAGNGSQPLSISKAASYIQTRFGEDGARV
ncbi:MAG: ATP-binding protein [Caldilineales bacterium]|nr:ATP-binding protein [Caldilineales bacterium]